MDKPKIYINKTQRKNGYDYNLAGGYFITICLENRKCLFGKVENNVLTLSSAGQIAERCWFEIPKHFKSVDLREFIVMPNHIHGIIFLCEDVLAERKNVFKNTGIKSHQNVNQQVKKMHQRLSIVIGSYKSAVTKEINKAIPGFSFKWQTSFYDHIIRNEKGLEYISDYIKMNPTNWNKDLENENYLAGLSLKEKETVIKEFYTNSY